MGQKKNSEFFSELVVGFFMVAILCILAYFTIVISGIDLIKGKTSVPITVKFDNVGGLKVRDPVVLRGMNVGSVDGMELKGNKVEVTVLISDTVDLKEGYKFQICSGSLLGGNYLSIEEGTGKDLPKDTVFVGEPPNQWMRDLSAVVADIREATAGGHLKNIVTNLDDSIVSVRKIATRVEEGKGMLGKLLSDDMSMYNDLSNAVANLRSITVKIDSGTNSLGRLLNDDGDVYGSLRDSLANLRSISDRLEKGEGTLGKLLSKDDKIYRDLSETMERIKNVAVRLDNGEGTLGKLMKDDNKVYNDLEAAVANLKSVTERLEKGEGTLGKLSADDALYEDVHGLIKDVRQTVDNFRDTTPITAFSSLLLGGL